jgi:ribonuclease VapC
MIIDGSVLVTIVLVEPGWELLRERVAGAERRALSAVSLVEAGMVLENRKGPAGAHQLDSLVHDAGLDVIALDERQSRLAREAFRHFGRGRHPARLDFGDCRAYALARASGEPLLFKGDDLARTDIEPVLAPD